ncbi:MHYT domain-containing protein [Aurantimonas sp. 22II-16-19i]|uniref:MHYT domain-containing protein n=1 Tax=Aurantimonas sp. 22II-16-19i TaxID=1317114 RepID=UPI0009F7FABA|nr:MHYT domain-containing protein [Aurantimonas sp. 22II-16-19i]ORE90617.1 PAS/PAC sensor hybrid histidine kinase [Aurantimonas sp. 22II-16-19i]
MIIEGTYSGLLVVLSICIATVAAYTALDLAGRVRSAAGWIRTGWIATAAIAMGGGIWSMHFVAMLAYRMPMEVSYDVTLTALSLGLPIVVTGIGFALLCDRAVGWSVLIAGGLIMGCGIATMHYLGMHAMQMPGTIDYDLRLVSASVAIAIGASIAALWLGFTGTVSSRKFAASGAMGLAISGMHYTGMAAATITMHPDAAAMVMAPALDPMTLAAAVAALTFLILFLALLASIVDQRFALASAREAAAILKSQERFVTLYRRTPLPLHALNENGCIEHVSDVWLEVLGYEVDEVVGRPLTDFMSEASARRRVEVDWPALLASKEVRGVEYQFVTKDGRQLDCLLSAHIERDAEGRFVQALCGLVDITARRQAEEQLRQSQKIEALGQLTGGIAHDFNNLLAAVLGNLEILRKRLPDDPKLQQLADTAILGAQRGASLTQRMLSFSRRQDLRPVAVNLPELVHGMADLLQRSIGPTVQIETKFPIGLPLVKADANQLELALLNLAVNARDSMPEGGTITISTKGVSRISPDADLAAGDYVCLTVTDTGCGMDSVTLAAATQPFFTTKGVGKGTGLGLSMVHGFAGQSGGQFVLSSAVGVGTIAEIWLPVATALPVVEETSAPSPAETKPASVRPLTILAVDDDAIVLMGTVAMLEELGHQVIEATSGKMALELLRENAVDLVITDQAMPLMTGLQLIAAVRQDHPELPVLLATGYVELPPGVDQNLPRLSKPFSSENLAEAMNAALAASRSANVTFLHQRLR